MSSVYVLVLVESQRSSQTDVEFNQALSVMLLRIESVNTVRTNYKHSHIL